MILKGFKEKSNKKYINSELKKRVVYDVKNKINTIGIIVNSEESIDLKWFDTLAKTLNLNPIAVKVIAFKSDIKKDEQVFNPTYEQNDIGWRGTIKNKELKQFLDHPFEVLISYYKKDIIALKLLTVASKAKFKVGILETDERINDLIIKTEIQAFEIFKSEFEKYLKILNKL